MFAFVAAMVLSDVRLQHPLPGPIVPEGWGVNIHFTHPKPGEMEMIREAGFKWVRMDFFWHQIETEKGKYDFSNYDVLVTSLKRHGLKPLFILDYGNDLYQKGSPSTPEAREGFCRFVEAAVRRYKGNGFLWEMWNEPNIHFWQPVPNVKDYIALAIEVGQTIRKVAPEEYYIGPATSGFDWRFLETCFQAGLLQFWDAVTVHPYRNAFPETVLEDWPKLRALIDRYAPKGKAIPMFSGEWGYSEKYSGLSLDLQSRYAPRQYLANLIGGANLTIWYDWKDDGTDPNEIEHHFGTVYPDLRLKPTYANIQSLAKSLDGYRFSKRLAGENRNHFRALFARGADCRLVEWSAEPGSDTNPVVTAVDLPKAFVDWPALPSSIRASTTQDLAKRLAWENAPSGAQFRVVCAPESDPSAKKEVVTNCDSTSLEKALKDLPRFQDLSETKYILEVHLLFGGKSLCQSTEWPPPHSHRLLLGSPVPGIVWSVFDPSSGFPTGPVKVRLEAGGKTLRTESVSNGQGYRARLDEPDSTVASVVQVGDGKVAFPPVRFHQVRTDLMGKWNWIADGDAKVPAQTALKIGTPPPGLPFSCSQALKLDYRFSAGWRYAALQPSGRLALPEKAVSLSFWVFGDGSSNRIRLRFTDESGQTFQPDGPVLDWKGWRFVAMPLTPGQGGFWGGKSDGMQHGRIYLDSAFLLDSVPPRENLGTVWIAGMSIAYRP